MGIGGAHLSLEHDAKPMSVIRASPRTACVWPGYVRTFLCCFHSLIVLSAEPERRGDRVRGPVGGRTSGRVSGR